MTAGAPLAGRRGDWIAAGALALTAHLAAVIAVLGWAREAQAPVPEPVVLVELPPAAAPLAPPAEAAAPAAPEARPIREPDNSPPVDAPRIEAPVPRDALRLPPPAVAVPDAQPAPAAEPAPLVPAPVQRAQQAAGSDDPRARKKAADYYALLMAHLERRKSYPTEARKARQQGVVTVRFTVARSGAVTDAAIKRSSGHDLLDRATLDLLARVSPLPPLPPEMNRDSVTISLPISYALNSK